MSLIIVPIDYSANSKKALDQAFLLAHQTGSQVELLHLVELNNFSGMPKILEMVMSERKEEEAKLKILALNRIAALGIEPGIRWRVKLLYTYSFLNDVLNRFVKAKAKLVVMGTHGVSGLTDKIFGSNTANLIGRAKVPVLAIPAHWKPAAIKKMSVCGVSDQISQHAKLIGKWSKWLGCEVETLYFTALPGIATAVKSPFPHQIVPNPIETPLYQDLVEYSSKLKDEMLVMFNHKRSFFDQIFDASITEKVAGLVQIPLLTLPVEEKE